MLKWIGRFFAFIGFFVFLSLVIVIFTLSKGTIKQTTKPNSVLHIKLDGHIHETDPTFSVQSFFEERTPSLRALVQLIEQAKSDPNIIGIVSEIKQPHMGVAQVQELREALLDFSKSGKFSYAFADTFGEFSPAFSHYYLATAHKSIWLQPLGHLCITGIHYEAPFARKLLEEWEVNPQIGRRMEYKTAFDSFTEFNMTPAHEESTRKVLQSIFDQMLTDIEHDRSLLPEAFKKIIDAAPIFDPHESKSLNLVDQVGYFYDLEEHIHKTHSSDAHLLSAEHYEKTLRPQKDTPQSIALIFASGEIIRDDRAFHSLTDNVYITPKSIEQSFKEALKDPSTRAIVFRVSSPGGSPIASESIAGQVKLAQKKGIPVIVSMSDVAGSGGYWISCYANKIVAQPATITGSIGVIGGKIATEKLWNRLGIYFEGIKIGQSADMWSIIKPYDVEGWKKLQHWLDYIYDAFLDHVAKGRNLSPEQVKELAKGRIWSGEDAKKFGLVDELGGLNKAITIAKNEAKLSLADPISIKMHPQAKGFLDHIISLTAKEKAAINVILQRLNRLVAIFDAPPALKMSMDPENIK